MKIFERCLLIFLTGFLAIYVIDIQLILLWILTAILERFKIEQLRETLKVIQGWFSFKYATYLFLLSTKMTLPLWRSNVIENSGLLRQNISETTSFPLKKCQLVSFSNFPSQGLLSLETKTISKKSDPESSKLLSFPPYAVKTSLGFPCCLCTR